ncbi:MAG: hypothetical protein HY548_00780 [Elusimicrobia bacterium]|nr:hypothetical protein [Elusimicrobiota bacterium]
MSDGFDDKSPFILFGLFLLLVGLVLALVYGLGGDWIREGKTPVLEIRLTPR